MTNCKIYRDYLILLNIKKLAIIQKPYSLVFYSSYLLDLDHGKLEYETQSYQFQWISVCHGRSLLMLLYGSILPYWKQTCLSSGVKSYVGILLRCLKKLTGIIVLALFFLIVFSLIGMGFFMGNLKHKCFRWPQENETEILHNRTRNSCYTRGKNRLLSMSNKLNVS